jgi:hypothetical protein
VGVAAQPWPHLEVPPAGMLLFIKVGDGCSIFRLRRPTYGPE